MKRELKNCGTDAPQKRIKAEADLTQHKIIIGIDYGTTFSGVAFATTDKTSIEDIKIVTNWPGDRLSSWKTPTRIAYRSENPNITTDKWGFEVSSKMKSYSWTKLLLDKKADASIYDDPSLTLVEGSGMLQLPPFRDATGVCEDFLNKVYLHVSQRLRTQLSGPTFEKTPIECWITLPAIWSDEAKAATLTAAKKAGFGSKIHDEVYTISEPEAAAISTLKRYAQTGALNPIREHENVLICDCGGGTVDITSYTVAQTKPNLVFDELCVGTGAKCGSTYIDRNLHGLLSKRFGKAYDDLPNALKSAGGKLMSCFEILKREFSRDDNMDKRELGPISLDVPNSGLYDWEDQMIMLSYEDMQSLFDPVIAQIKLLLSDQIEGARRERKAVINRIILVGGFGESTYLNQILTDWCKMNSGITLLCPENPQAAVVQGAVLRGLDGIASRIKRCRRHYGFIIGALFREGVDPEELAYFDDFDEKRCHNRTEWILQKGDEITEETFKKYGIYLDWMPGQVNTCEILLLSCSLAKLPEYSTDTGVKRVGKIISTIGTGVDLGDSVRSEFNKRKNKMIFRFIADVHVQFGNKGDNLTFKNLVNGIEVGSADIVFD